MTCFLWLRHESDIFLLADAVFKPGSLLATLMQLSERIPSVVLFIATYRMNSLRFHFMAQYCWDEFLVTHKFQNEIFHMKSWQNLTITHEN